LEKANLQTIKQEVDRFEAQKAALQTQIGVIENLQKNRTGAQELLQMVANTVVRVDQLWLTSLERKGDSLDIVGEAGSVNSIANFITQLKRSGYFDKIEINEAKEDDVAKSVTTYNFTMSAAIAQPAAASTGQPQTKPAAGTTTTPPQPAPKGRS
jgi:Tfp pilus assembly protein PilN